MLSETADASARKKALLLSFRAFDLAIVAALQSGLPLGEWFRCALVHMASKAQGPGGEISTARRTSDTLSGELALDPESNTVSHDDPSKDLVKQAGNALETAQNPVNPESNTASDNDPSKDVVTQAGGALEGAQNRINELCDALQGLIDLSDCKRVRDLAEVKRSLARAKEVLLASKHVGSWPESSAANCDQQNEASEAA